MKDEILTPFGLILAVPFFAFLLKFVKGRTVESPEVVDEDDEGFGDDDYIVRWDKDGNQAEWGREFRLDEDIR